MIKNSNIFCYIGIFYYICVINIKHGIMRTNKLLVSITTYNGICCNATHYYGKLSYYDDKFEYVSEELRRMVTDEDLKTPEFSDYLKDDFTNRFNSWKEVLYFAKEYITKNNLEKYDVVVEGLPNISEEVTIEDALSDNIDTRSKCTSCGHIFGFREGLYNLPSGKLCCSCYDKKFKRWKK